MAVLLEHTTGTTVGAHGLGIRLQLQALIQPRRELEQELQLTQECVDTLKEQEMQIIRNTRGIK